MIMTCSAPGCEKKAWANARAFGGLGVCRKHYDIWQRAIATPGFWKLVQEDLREQSAAAYAAHGFAAFRHDDACQCGTLTSQT